MKNFDIIVIGAGHAGCEAALAAARLGCSTLLLATNLDTVAFLACNPSIGGTAKGQIVKEIDALGGEMAINADKSLLQMRMLNRGKGPAVYSPRAQVDKNAYHVYMKQTIENTPNLYLRHKYCAFAKPLGPLSLTHCPTIVLEERYTPQHNTTALHTYCKSTAVVTVNSPLGVTSIFTASP